jgi:hypothetical protein
MPRKLGKTLYALSAFTILGCASLLSKPKEPGPLVETCILSTKPREDVFEITVGKTVKAPKPRAVCQTRESTTEIRTLESVHKYVCLPPSDLEALILWGTRD